MRSLILLSVFGLALAACKGSDPLGCATNKQCPSGQVCTHSRCAQVCNEDSECAGGRGYVCDGNICQPGVRKTPQIDAVFGNGSLSCPGSLNNRCFANGVIVQGENLDGCGAVLESTTGGANFVLSPGEDRTAQRFAAIFPNNLAEGRYRLVVKNAAGQDQADVLVLQGEPGPALTGQQILDKVNAEATGTFVIARLPIGTGADQVARGNHTHTGSGGQTLHFQAAPGSHTSPVPIAGQDLTTMEQLCGEPNGCSIAIGYRYYNDASYGLCESVLWGPPCRLHIDAAKRWAVSPWCLKTGPYSSWGWDQDNNDQAHYVLASAANAINVCVLSDGAGPTGSDNQAGYFFWMENTTAGGTFTDANRRCELYIGN